jgi:sterol desaturase/sphingolipid hydroxylase (fatty acid hydroxylase superfamily)
MIASDQSLLFSALILGAVLVLLSAEWLKRRRILRDDRAARWRSHIGFVAINMPVDKLTQAAMAIALYGGVSAIGSGNFGLLPLLEQLLGLPLWAQYVLAILLLDLAVWAQHLATHHIPLLWRLHRVHHVDRDFDMTTALRFHPLEIALSMVYKMAIAFLLGVPLGALIIFELLLALFPLFNHANIRLPLGLDKALRLVVVTPDVHRVHHSIIESETNSNFGFCFVFWDRLFGTYRAQPRHGHDDMTIGLEEWQDDRPRRFGWAMLFPFR